MLAPNNSSNWSMTSNSAALTSRSYPLLSSRRACDRGERADDRLECASSAWESCAADVRRPREIAAAQFGQRRRSTRLVVRSRPRRGRTAPPRAPRRDRRRVSPGRMTATRQRSMLGTTPAAVNRGTRPARTSEDLPEPLAPSTRRNGQPLSAASFSRSAALAISRLRPKNTDACLAPKAARPRNGEPLMCTGHTTERPCSTFSSSHLRSSASACASKSSVELNVWNAALNCPSAVWNQVSKKDLQVLPLRLDLGTVRIVELYRWRLWVAEHVHVRQSAGP